MRRSFAIPALLLLALATACDEPADPISVGRLCLPSADSCPDRLELHRPAPGRNSLELLVKNKESPASFHLLVTTPERFDLPWDPDFTEQDELILVDRTYALAPKEILREVFEPRELTVAKELHLSLTCSDQPCDLTLDYLFILEPVECYDDSSCSRGGICEIPFGQCAECSEDAHCSTEQTCDIRRGTCFPQSSRGCSQLPPSAPSPGFIALILGLIIFLASRSPRSRRVLLSLFVALSFSLIYRPAQAETPTVSFSAGGGIRLLTAEPGRLTRPGWGASIQHQLRYGRFGASTRLATHTFSLLDQTIPNELRLTGYALALGPRAYFKLPLTIPFARDEFGLEVLLGFDYMRWLVSQNRLANITGLALSYHAAGPTLGILWRWGGLKLMAQSNYSTIFGWPGGVFTIDLALGIEN